KQGDDGEYRDAEGDPPERTAPSEPVQLLDEQQAGYQDEVIQPVLDPLGCGTVEAERGCERLFEEHPPAVDRAEHAEPEQKPVSRAAPEEMCRDGCGSRRADDDGDREREEIAGGHEPGAPGPILSDRAGHSRW